MFRFITKNVYKKDGQTRCFVQLYDCKSDSVINCGPAGAITGDDLAFMVKDCVFGTPVEVELALNTFNGNVRPQIFSLHIIEEGKK